MTAWIGPKLLCTPCKLDRRHQPAKIAECRSTPAWGGAISDAVRLAKIAEPLVAPIGARAPDSGVDDGSAGGGHGRDLAGFGVGSFASAPFGRLVGELRWSPERLQAAASSSEAAIPDVFDGTVACVPQADGSRFCGSSSPRSTVETFDGVPIDVNAPSRRPPLTGPDGNYPLIMIFHGYGGGKAGLGIDAALARQGLRSLFDDRPRLSRVLRLGRLEGSRSRPVAPRDTCG